MNAKIITLWGAAGMGKTTTAVNLALAIADLNFMVGIISAKLYYGEMQGLFGAHLEHDKGIYKAISNGNNTKNMFEMVKGRSNVFFLSVPNTFDGMLLTAVSGETAKELIEDAAMRFDFLIIDGSEELNNPISSVGLSLASQIYVIHSPSVKDCLWQLSMSNTIRLLHLSDKMTHVLNAYDKSCDKVSYMANIGVQFGYELEYIQNAKILENSGTPIYTKRNVWTKNYRRTIEKIASATVLGGQTS